MDESIRLDRKSFEALAGQTRVKILKSLLKRRKTLTELSHELGLSPSTTKEHLDVLVDSELAQQVDEGRKWKYYELTRRGRSIVQPHELKVLIVLGLGIIAAGAAIFNLFYALQPQYAAQGLGAMETAEDSSFASEENAAGEAPRVAAAPPGSGEEGESPAMEAALAQQDGPAFPFLEAGIAAAALLVFSWAFLYARGKGVF
ncbi:MAG: winged helix-turn-helix domain-containing protein [Candidatus Micrarchaeia archaeon]|jgi:DNA-binding transcriptional ArsR family regulator